VGIGPVLARSRVLVQEILDRGAQAAGRGGARCASQVLDPGSQVLGLGAQADSRGATLVLDHVCSGQCPRRRAGT
jgi:hypothetical protein